MTPESVAALEQWARVTLDAYGDALASDIRDICTGYLALCAAWREGQQPNPSEPCSVCKAERDAALVDLANIQGALTDASTVPVPGHDGLADAVRALTAERDAALQRALPPLPKGWCREDSENRVLFGSSEATIGVTAYGYDRTRVTVEWSPSWDGVVSSLPDLITVLRHTEAAHQRLQEGQRG